MKKLLIDIGNTLIKTGVFSDKEVLWEERYSRFSEAEFSEILRKYPDIEAAMSCTVTDEPPFLPDALQRFPRSIHWNSYRSDLRLPVEICYRTPETLGRDRIAAASAAVSLFPGGNILCIVLGSCVTYNLIDAEKRFWGGAISPGLGMRLKAMHRYTGGLPFVEPAENIDTEKIDNTRTAVYSGALDGLRYEMEGYAQRYRQRFPDLKIVLGGGDVSYFEKSLDCVIFAYHNLVLRGLNEILDLNGF